MKCSIFFIIGYCVNLIGADPPLFLLTEERTGTHWSSYIVQAFTKKPFYSLDRNRLASLNFPLETNHDLEFVYRAHTVQKMPKNIDKDCSLLIVTLRDYHEVLFRGPPGSRYRIFSSTMRKRLDRYAAILKYYDDYPTYRRFLIHYENLITNPYQEIAAIFQFLRSHKLQIEEGQLEMFWDRYEEHRSWMVDRYHRARRSYTGGKHVHFHKNKASPELIEKIQRYLKKRHPLVWKKYFSRYEF